MKHDNVWTIEIDAPPGTVWDALTATGTPQPFYFDSVLVTSLRPGDPIAYRSQDGRFTFIEGKVLEVVPGQRLVHTFRFTDLPEESGTVTLLLEATGRGCRLIVTHDRLAPKHRQRVTSGWTRILRGLKAWLETGRLPLSARLANGMFRLLTPVIMRRHPVT